MKMKKNIVFTIIIIAAFTLQCSKVEQSLSLKESIEANTAKINSAVNMIAGSEGYQILSLTESGTKSDYLDSFSDSIDLKLIAGKYDFKPGNEQPRNFYFPFRLFQKTGTSEKLIVNLPEKLVFYPKHLHFCNRADSALKNNFVISATDYHFYFNWWHNSDYKLVADLTKDSKEIGNLSIFTAWKSGSASSYSKNFTFPEGYSILRRGETGDTNKVVFALTQDKDTLLQEKLMFYGESFKRKEKLYILSIGNVDIVRGTEIDSIQVYLDGILQKTAGAKIIDDNQDYNSSICFRRDILLTFDDGTTAKLSELLSPARETLKSLSKAIEEMYFSKHIVDYIAFSIYYNNH
jgi:hypothetical protein